ncbi:MAG: hypothetical protein OHK0017_12050 [Patescibacteria group bacterium]
MKYFSLFKKIPKWLSDFIKVGLYLTLYYFIFNLFIPGLRPFLEWASTRKFVIIQSIGALATSFAVGYSLIDIRNKWKFEKMKFSFEAEPLIKPLHMPVSRMLNKVSLGDKIERKVNFISGEYLDLFVIQNYGRGIANEVKIFLSQDLLFEDKTTLVDGPFELTPNETQLISKDYFYNEQNLTKINWLQNFYIKLEYCSFLSNSKFIVIYKADVRLARMNSRDINNPVTEQKPGEFPNIELSNQEDLYSYIHNFTPISKEQVDRELF